MTYNNPKKHNAWNNEAWEKQMEALETRIKRAEEKMRLKRPRILKEKWEKEEARKFNWAWRDYFGRSNGKFELGFDIYEQTFTVENIHTYLDIYKKRKSRWERNRRFIRSVLFFLFLCIFI